MHVTQLCRQVQAIRHWSNSLSDLKGTNIPWSKLTRNSKSCNTTFWSHFQEYRITSIELYLTPLRVSITLLSTLNLFKSLLDTLDLLSSLFNQLKSESNMLFWFCPTQRRFTRPPI
ncbi:hypothetical protein PanWU01x14_363680 [Parasponia andersonii]|uniref:Uncharacterized protein n=1 Tax=Parasponia andersonii TaxID=3476 RepID=A0A2P5A6L0_PARAD|nr:hypothetical protein PanWU01x14_363680 [Parasponia andersonii]